MRTPRYAGLFYEKAETLLREQIKECFEGEKGPGATPPEKTSQKNKQLPQAIIVPHAGYKYSGQCAAWGYKELGEAPLPDVYIILAPSHHYLESGITQEPFQTPFGIIRVDQDLARRIIEKGTIKENPKIHEEEHAIEVQLPMLQYIHKAQIEKIRILPILVSPDLNLKQAALDIKEALLESGKKAVIIVSSDFTHYGPNYRYLPFTSNVPENIAKLDKEAIDLIMKGQAEEFLNLVDEKMMTICGANAIALMLKAIKPGKARLEQYYTSAEITGDWKNSVSYATIIFE